MNNKLETISNLFEDKEIRSIWDSENEEYYFSVVDIIGALTNANIPRNYWSDLKRKLSVEGSQLHENIVQLKMKSKKDGKSYLTDTLDTKGVLRLIESVPSPKAEPFKLWLANLGNERIDEVFDPEIAINRAVNYYRNKGYTDEWIKARLTGIVDRFKLTDIWKEGGITKPMEYAMLTNEIYKGWSGMKASEYKEFLKKANINNGLVVDLKLFSDSINKNISKLENGVFKVYVPLNDELRKLDLTAYYVKDNGEIEKHDVKIEGDYLVFETDHFSTYVIGGNKLENPATLDNVSTWIITTGVSLLVFAGAVLYKRKFNN